jgi:hypothetical protein
MVFFSDGDILYPVVNMPVFFEVTKGRARITDMDYTNSNGVAECMVFNVDMLDDDALVISAGISLAIGEESFTITKLERDFAMHHLGIGGRTIAFIVFERNIDEVVGSSASGKLIENLFIQNGFSVLQGISELDSELFASATGGEINALEEYMNRLDSSLIGFTSIESVFSSKVSEGFYFARSDIALKVFDTETRRIVFNSLVQGVKGAGSTEHKAGREAIKEATTEFLGQLTREIEDFGPSR